MPKILLVEDDNNLREIYEARLKAEGYEIVTASNGEEALVVAKENKPDLIIADVMMPKISGFEMLDILRNTAGLQDVKIIMLTALGQADDQQKATSLGADKYLVKSQVTLEDIVNTAHELLEGHSQDGQQATPDLTMPATPAPAVSPTPTPAPASPAPQPAAPQNSPAAPANAATDDKLLDDALTSLGGGNDSKASPSPAEPSAAPAVAQPAAPQLATPEPAPAPAAQAPPASPVPEPAMAPPAPPSEPPQAPPLATQAPAAPTDVTTPPPQPESPLEIDKELESQLEEESKEVESADTKEAMQDINKTGPLPVVPPADPGADNTTVTSDIEAESATAAMKVIKPLPTEEKKDINTLLEQEQLNGAANPQTGEIPPSNPDEPQVVTPTEPPEDNSASSAANIAL